MRRRASNRTMLLRIGLLFSGLLTMLGAAIPDADSPSSQEPPASGEVSVVAEVRGGISRPGEVVVYVFRRDDHDEVVTAMRAGERVSVDAGSYDLRVVLKIESEERDVEWLHDVSIEAGAHTERQVSFTRGALLVHARNAGKPLPTDAVELNVYRAGDEQEEVIDWGSADEPLDLAPGRYDVKATFVHSNDQPVRWLRGLELTSDGTRRETVEFASGTLAIGATSNGGRPVGTYGVYVYYYRPEDHAQPIGYTPAGEPAVLEGGTYDVRAHFLRSHDQPDIWLRDVVVQAGEVAVQTVAFPSAELLLRIHDASGAELVGDNAFVYVYASGQRSRPIASARGGESLILTEDVYDIRVVDTRHPGEGVWLSAIRLEAGTPTERDVVVGEVSVPTRESSPGEVVDTPD
jgi:hypothetical protein